MFAPFWLEWDTFTLVTRMHEETTFVHVFSILIHYNYYCKEENEKRVGTFVPVKLRRGEGWLD